MRIGVFALGSCVRRPVVSRCSSVALALVVYHSHPTVSPLLAIPCHHGPPLAAPSMSLSPRRPRPSPPFSTDGLCPKSFRRTGAIMAIINASTCDFRASTNSVNTTT
eukprot:scaffold132180_cov31-Tisochrysis_lutea.AAC.2